LNATHGPPASHGRLVASAVVFGVYDGLGQSPTGETASNLAAHAIHAALRSDWPQLTCEQLGQELVLAVEAANHRIFSGVLAERSLRGLGSTAIVAAAVDRHLKLAHVGDTRAYLLRDRRLWQVTRDHSLLNELVDAGRLTPAEAETFEHRNVITRALGVSESVKADPYSMHLLPADVVLLCTDGIHRLVGEDRLLAILVDSTDPSECAAALIDAAEQAGGHDNETAIVAMVRPFG